MQRAEKKPRVLIACLTGTERQTWINPELMRLVWNMGRDPRFDVEIVTIKDATPVEVARNHTIKLARDHNFDWLVSFDSDNFMPAGTPLDIIAAAGREQSVIGLAYGHFDNGSGVAGYQLLPSRDGGATVDGLFQEVPWVAGGVLMVNRRVWEKIPRGPWFRRWEDGEMETETLERATAECEDCFFCRLTQQHGFRTWTHTQLLAGHYRTTDLTGMICTMSQMTGGAGNAGGARNQKILWRGDVAK